MAVNQDKERTRQYLTQFKHMRKIRKPWTETWELISKYLAPRKELYGARKDLKGHPHGKYIYDSDPIYYMLMMSEGMQGHLVSPQSKWQRLKLSQQTRIKAQRLYQQDDYDLDDDHDVKHWLQMSDESLYALYQRSNFYETMSEFFADAIWCGTSTIYQDRDYEDGIPIYRSIDPDEIYIAVDRYGRVDTVYRHYKMTLRQMVEEFGFDNLHANLQQVLRQKDVNVFEEKEILHIQQPRKYRDITKLDAKNKKYESVYLDLDNEWMLRDSGTDRMRYIVWRYKTTSCEIYGKSPAWDALYSVIPLNQSEKAILTATQLAVDPVVSAHESMRGRISKRPGAINYYRTGQQTPQPWNYNQTWQDGVEWNDRKKLSIRQIFRVDFFLALQSAERQMTATEIMERQGEKAILLGPAVARLNNDALQPNVDLTFDVANELGYIPPLPEVLQPFQGERLDVDFVGPLAQAQEQYLRTQPIRRTLEMIAPYFQVWPEGAQMIRVYEAFYEIMKNNGMPQDTIVPREEFEAIMEMQRQQAAANAQAQQQLMQAEAYSKGVEAPEPGSLNDVLAAQGMPV